MIEVRQISTKSNDFKNIKRVYNTVFPQNELLPLSLLLKCQFKLEKR